MIGRKTMLGLANVAVGMLLGLAAQRVIALYWGAEYSGQVTFALGAVGLLFFLADMGMGYAHIKRVSEGRDPGDCFATFAVFKAVATLGFMLLVIGLLWLYTVVLGRTIEDTTLPIIGVVLLYYMFKAVQEVAQASFEARVEAARSQLTSLVDTTVRVVATLVFGFGLAAVLHESGPLHGVVDPEHPFWSWVRENPAEVLAGTQLLGTVVASAFGIWMLFRVFDWGRFRWDLLKDYWTFALPLFLVTAVASITANIDATALGLFMGATEAGIFGRVRVIAGVLSAVAPALGGVFFPTVSALAARGDTGEIERHMNLAVRYLSMLLLPPVLFTIFFADELILLILSAEFLPGALPMGALAAYYYIMAVAAPHAHLIGGVGKPRILAQLGITTAVTVVVLDVLLVPNDIKSLGIRLPGLGMLGAALGTLASGIIYYVMARRATRQIAGYHEQGHKLRHLVAALVMVGALLLVQQFVMPLDRWFHLPVYAVAGALVYLGVLLVMREFTRTDLGYLRQVVHPIEMLRYIRDELRHRKPRNPR